MYYFLYFYNSLESLLNLKEEIIMTTENLIDIGNRVFEPKHFNPSQLNISSRQINYWISNGLVPFTQIAAPKLGNKTTVIEQTDETNGPNKWVRLNLTQSVWVCIINELFMFRVSMDAMKELTYRIWQKPREEKYADDVLKFHIKNNPNRLPKVEIEKLKLNLKDEQHMEHYLRTIINPFTDMVKSAICRKGYPHTLLYVPETFDHAFHYGDKSLITDLGSIYIEKPMVSIPIAPMIAKALLADFNNKKRKNLEYLNHAERQIRDIVVFKRPKVVEIAFQDDSISTIVITEDHKSRQELADYIVRNKIKKGSKLLIDIRSDDNYKITLIKTKKI